MRHGRLDLADRRSLVADVRGMRSASAYLGVASALVVLATSLAAAPATAQVDCSVPDNLCTGDPCVIFRIEVASPCVVDFGTRFLVVAGQITVPDGGTLSLSAGRIAVLHGSIRSKSTSAGASVSLSAGGKVEIAGRIRLVGGEGNTVHVTAGGDLAAGGSGILVSGYRGSVVLSASNILNVSSGIVVRGGTDSVLSPTIVLSAGTNVIINGRLQATHPRIGTGGTVSADAGWLVVNGRRIGAKNGRVVLRGTAGVHVENPIDVRGQGSIGVGIVLESTAGDVTVDWLLLADGHGDGAGGDGRGGQVTITAAGTATVSAGISATGPSDGGVIDIESTAGDVVVQAPLSATTVTGGPDGSVELRAAGTVTVGDDINVARGGNVHVEGGSVQVPSGVTLSTAGQFSSLRLTASTGDLTLSGSFLAPPFAGGSVGGTIEGMAAGNVLADGVFRAAPSGCIALAAGGVLDTTGGTFDVPFVADCPGS